MWHKFIGVIVFILLLVLNVSPVKANSAAPLYAIIVEIEGCDYENSDEFYNVDVLVNTTRYSSYNFLDSVNQYYTIEYPDYTDFDYLKVTEGDWVSYSAYFENADVNINVCYIELVDTLDFVNPILEIKVVYFNDLGETLFTSELININPELANSRIEGSILFNPTTLEVTNAITEYDNSSIFDTLQIIAMFTYASILFIPLLIYVSSLFEALISGFFKFKKIKRTSVFWLNIITQIIMYILFSKINLEYYVTLVIVEIAIYTSEYLVLIKVYKEEDKRKVLYFILIANTVTLLMGHLLGFY